MKKKLKSFATAMSTIPVILFFGCNLAINEQFDDEQVHREELDKPAEISDIEGKILERIGQVDPDFCYSKQALRHYDPSREGNSEEPGNLILSEAVFSLDDPCTPVGYRVLWHPDLPMVLVRYHVGTIDMGEKFS